MKEYNAKVTKEVLVCSCFSTEHQIAVTYNVGDTEDDFDEMSIEIHLTSRDGFFKRIGNAIKYIFGYKSKFGDWDDFIIDIDHCNKLIPYLEKMRSNNEQIIAKRKASN